MSALKLPSSNPSAPAPNLRRRRQIGQCVALVLGLALIVALAWTPLCVNRLNAALALQDLQSAERWLIRAGWTDIGSRDLLFARARYLRRTNRLEEMLAALRNAKDRGLDPARLQLEADLALAASGNLSPLKQKLPRLLQESAEDLPDICDAYVSGCLLNYQISEAEHLLGLWQADFPLDPQPRFLQGRLDEHRSDLVSAEKSFRTALELSPRHAAAACNLGRILLAQQKPEEALGWYQRAARCLAEPQPALVGIARCHRELGQLDQARQTLELAAARPGNRLIESYRLVGERSETALAQVPAEFGQLELSAERFEQATEWFERAVTANPYDWRTRHSYATALRQVGRQEDADAQNRRAAESRAALESCDRLIGSLQQNPADAEIRYRIGMVLLQHVSPNQGLVWLNSVLTYDPQHGPAHRALADYFANHTGENPDYAELATRHRKAADAALAN